MASVPANKDFTMFRTNTSVNRMNQYRIDPLAAKDVFLSHPGWEYEPTTFKNVKEEDKLTIILMTGRPEVFSIKGKFKTMAVILSPVFYNVLALSGCLDDHPHLPIIYSSTWTLEVGKLAADLNLNLPKHYRDYWSNGRGWPGSFHACHAEAKLMAFYMLYYINYKEALQTVGYVCNWNIQILVIAVSRRVCGTCGSLAEHLDETYGIKVVFVEPRPISNVKCTNYYCNIKLFQPHEHGGFCGRCQFRQDHDSDLSLTLLPMKRLEYFKHIFNTVAGNFGVDALMINEVLLKLSQMPMQGLHLYLEGKVTQRSLNVLIPHPRTVETAEMIDDIIKTTMDRRSPADRAMFHRKARRAVFTFIEKLGISELTEAFGKMNDFPWTTTASPRPESGVKKGGKDTAVTALEDQLGSLQLKDEVKSPIVASFADDSNSSDSENTPQVGVDVNDKGNKERGDSSADALAKSKQD